MLRRGGRDGCESRRWVVIGKNVRKLQGWNWEADRGKLGMLSKQPSHVTVLSRLRWEQFQEFVERLEFINQRIC
jgi:hypothetical protein